MAKTKLVYYFGAGKADGKATMKELLGGKGANLAEMCNLGLPVPAGFTISTQACVYCFQQNGKHAPELKKQIDLNLKKLEKEMGQKFGDKEKPLLLSVRSGARASMPGMMDTVLNLGLNDATAKALTDKTENGKFVYDSYRRFIQMFANVVMGIDGALFKKNWRSKKRENRSNSMPSWIPKR